MHKIIDSRTVHDRVVFCAGDQKLKLRVDKDGRQIVADLTRVRDRLGEITEDNLQAQIGDCARGFAEAIFGPEQAGEIMALYNNPASVINVCEQYFRRYLGKKITRAQIR